MREGNWSLFIKDMSWVEKTGQEVDFIVAALGLEGSERVLDLACGFGRHSLELARRGWSAVGVDYSRELIDDAVATARRERLGARFVHADVLSLDYRGEFDVVLNMADGAIGYFETEGENLQLFDVISNALKPRGKHVMGVCSAEYFRKHCPWRAWQAGTKILSVSDFRWNDETSRMLYRSHQLRFGEVVEAFPDEFPEGEGSPGIRLYTVAELSAIFEQRDMRITGVYGTYDLHVPASDGSHFMSVVCSEKTA